jgi:hypothetical protein
MDPASPRLSKLSDLLRTLQPVHKMVLIEDGSVRLDCLLGEFVDVNVAGRSPALRDTMRLTYPERSIGEQFPIKALAIVVVLN